MSCRFRNAAFAALALCASSFVASAADTPRSEPNWLPVPHSFYIHAGIAGVSLSEGASIVLGGAPVPGGTISVKPQMTFIVELGYFITPNIAVSFTGGWPPRAQIHGAGTLAGFPKLGIATYGPMAATIHYHFSGMGRFQPYIGFGPTFLLSVRTQDRLITQAKLDNALGFAGQIGFNYMINEKWGLFFDVKKAYLRSKASGFIGAAPLSAKVKLDPLVVSTGIAYRF